LGLFVIQMSLVLSSEKIALACGFANQSHLTTTFKKPHSKNHIQKTTFKKHSGTTPKAYQAQQ
jgi:AraC-like DNA-binding protein